MGVIGNARLIERRLQRLREKRQRCDQPRGSRGALPDWAAEALVQAGMTRAEIRALDAETVDDDPDDGEAAVLDARIDALESELLTREIDGMEALGALAEVALARLRRETPTDPRDLFYDAGEARTLRLFEKVVHELHRVALTPCRRVG